MPVISTGQHADELEELYESHAAQAMRFAFVLTGVKEVAEDVTQEAFLRAFEKLPQLRERAAFGAYLRTCVLNACRAYFRRLGLERRSTRRRMHVEMDVRTDSAIEDQDVLWRALQRLPYRQRAALVLRYYEDLSEREAARVLGVSLSALKALKVRGMRTLRHHLASQLGEELSDE